MINKEQLIHLNAKDLTRSLFKFLYLLSFSEASLFLHLYKDMIQLTIISLGFLIASWLIFGKCLLTLSNRVRDTEEVKHQKKVVVAKLI